VSQPQFQLAINGVVINLGAHSAQIDGLTSFVKGGIPQLHFSRLGITLAALPDPWDGQSVTLTLIGTPNVLVFAGDVNGYSDRYDRQLGWIRQFIALGLIDRAAEVPVTDSETLTDTSVWNVPGDDYQNFIGARAGKNVGQIVADILTMSVNAVALNNRGIGNYTYTGAWNLPAATMNDLAALTIMPPFRVSISGERILQGLEGFVQSCHPNHFVHVEPGGNIRFLDPRNFAATTLTIGADPRIEMPSLTRDHSDCWSQVEVRGNTLVTGMTLKVAPWPGSSLSDGGIQEDFAWGPYNNAAAKTHWTPSCWNQPLQSGTAQDIGTCTCPDTLHVNITSSGSSIAYPANYWDQSATGVLGNITLFADLYGGSSTQIIQRRVVASTAQSAPGGTFSVTLDQALPGTAYNAYQLWGLTAGCNAVGRKYKVTNPAIGQALMQYFPWPYPVLSANGNAATMTSTPLCQVIYNPSGTPNAAQIAVVGITIDPVNGIIYTDRPTQTIFGNPQWPTDVWFFVPVASGTLTAYAPSSTGYSGTLYTQLGIQRRKIITVNDWRDYSNQNNMNVFAAEQLGAMSDIVWEGTLPYYGALTQFLAPGNSINIAGSGYTTGWESLALPIVSIELGFLNGNTGTSYSTVLHLSNRRGRYSPAAFLRPNMQHGQYTAGTTIGARGIAWGGIAAVSGETMYDEGANAAAEDYRQQQAADAATQAPYRSRYATTEQLEQRDVQRQARQDQAASMRRTLDRARRAEVARQRREGVGAPKGPAEIIAAMPEAATRLEEAPAAEPGLTPMPGGEETAANP
jgi:hypothetical protein